MTPSVPEIVIIGQESSGKSSVLNLLAEAVCPVLMMDENTATRVPTKLQLIHSDEEPWLQMYREGDDREGGPGKGAKYDGEQLSQAALNAAFRTQQIDMAGAQGFSDALIVIEYHGQVQPLTLIDLPGFAVGLNEHAKIKEIAEKYIEVSSRRLPPLVVCVMSADTRINTDASVRFIKDMQGQNGFQLRELVIVHNKLDRFEDKSGLADKIQQIGNGIEGVSITHFGVKAMWNDGLSEDELAEWTRLIPEVKFGVDPLRNHLAQVLSNKFRMTLPMLIQQLEASIQTETDIIDSIQEPLSPERSTIREILELAYDQFTATFTQAGIVRWISNERKMAAKAIVKSAQDQACQIIEKYKQELLQADKEKPLFDLYLEQKQKKVLGAGWIFATNKLEFDMDATKGAALLVDKLHRVLAECMQKLTKTLVYPALRDFRKEYDISPDGPYAILYGHLQRWIEESFHGLSGGDWRKIRQQEDRRTGRSLPSVAFDSHQLLDWALKSTSVAFTAQELKQAPEGKIREALQVLDQSRLELLELKSQLKGSPCFREVVSSESLQLLEELIKICEKATEYPTYYSHLDQIRTPDGSTRPSLINWCRDATSKIKLLNDNRPQAMLAAPQAPAIALPIECDGAFEYIGTVGFSLVDVWKKGSERFIQVEENGMLQSWRNKDDCILKRTPTSKLDLATMRGNFTVEKRDDGLQGRQFRVNLKPTDGGVRRMYSFPSACERNRWLEVFNSYLPPLPPAIPVAPAAAAAAAAPALDQLQLGVRGGGRDDGRGGDGGGAKAANGGACATADEFYTILRELQNDLQEKEVQAKAAETTLHGDYHQKMEPDDPALTTPKEDGVRDIAWQMKKVYSNGAEFLSDELKKHIRKVFDYVIDNMMADDVEYKIRFTREFDDRHKRGSW